MGYAPNKGRGPGVTFLRENIKYLGDNCLLWPFVRCLGYGLLRYRGKQYRAHRFMCVLAHGEPPTSKHQAAHSCGNGYCVNPRHLSWKTNGENQLDRRRHGTTLAETWGRITPKQEEEIRRLRAGGMSTPKLAAMFGVTHSTIQYRLYGGSHKRRRDKLSLRA